MDTYDVVIVLAPLCPLRCYTNTVLLFYHYWWRSSTGWRLVVHCHQYISIYYFLCCTDSNCTYLLLLLRSFLLHCRAYADETQTCDCSLLFIPSVLQASISACVDDVAALVHSDRLQLNLTNTELLCSTASCWHYVFAAFRGGCQWPISRHPGHLIVQNLWIYIDTDDVVILNVAKAFSVGLPCCSSSSQE